MHEPARRDETTLVLRKTCWNEALEALGTAYIFEDRARKLRPRIRILSLLGIGVPAVVGGIVLTFGSDGWHVTAIRVLGAILLLAQLVLAVWAIVMGWEERLYYALDSATSNYHLADEFKALAADPPSSEEALRHEIDKLQRAGQERQRVDYRQHISDQEKRKGMRYALRYYGRTCAGCDEVPTSMESSSCHVCGNF